jgi:glycosyltransferase involved in cell wall biosynthesis
MTILFLARRFYPQIGGVEKHVLEIGKRLAKKGHRIVVITENPQKDYGDGKQSKLMSARMAGEVGGIEIYRISAGNDDWFKKFRVWRQMWGLKGLISDSDVIHCHDVFYWYLPFRFLFPLKKVYTTFHGYEGNLIPGKKAILMHKLAEKLSFGNICVGDFLAKWYGTKPTLVTYGAVEQKLINQGLKSMSPNSGKDVMFLGRLEEEAGILEYLRALEMLRDKGVVLGMDVFGDGELKNESINYSKKHNLNVNYKGFVSNASEFIKDYEYIFCSRYLGILEAMALQKPVFTQYNNEIKKDYLQMAPFAKYISIANDARAISRAVLNYRQKKNLEVGRAYLWVRNETWEKMVNLYLRLWTGK